jgi:hypothetical protein
MSLYRSPICARSATPWVPRPSADLLDTIYICQSRQHWYREYARDQGISELPFEVGPPYVEVDFVPREFYCPVCRLRVGDDLLAHVGMDETEYTTVDATDEEVEAEEAAAVESYYESLRE